MEKEEMTYLKQITKLTSNDSLRYQKYNRNYKMYTYSPNVSIDDLDTTVGYYQRGFYSATDSNTSSVQENVIYSCISTLVSKIASQKARPFINTINGSFTDINIAKAAQQYFDIVFDEQNIYKKISLAFRDACIFDTGWIYIDIKEHAIKNALPWQVFVDKNEASYGKRNHIVYKRTKFPVSLLPEDIYKEVIKETNRDYVTFTKYWNIKAHKEVTYISEAKYYKEEDYENDLLPFLDIHYETPEQGITSNSVVDILYGLQMKLDELLQKVGDAASYTPANTIFLPEDSTIKANKLTNEIGQIVTYTATPNMTGSPVTVATPSFIDPQYLQLIEQFKQDAYEMIGISQLSAMSAKPTGLDSGAALQTLENVESDRFQTQLNQVLRMYVDIAKTMIAIYPKNEEILPNLKTRLNIKWSDILKIKDKMAIQFSAADSLSKDPATKLKQLQMLSQAGILPANRIASLMEMPDLELGYSFAANSLNAINTVITDCIENDNYEVPPYISIEELKPEIMNICLQLKASGKDNEKDIEKLLKLYSTLIDTEQAVGTAQAGDSASQMLDDESNNLDYQTTQMDMQTEQMTSIANDLQNGVIDTEQANQMLSQMNSLGLEI